MSIFTQKPRNPETQKPRNPETQKPRNPETQKGKISNGIYICHNDNNVFNCDSIIFFALQYAIKVGVREGILEALENKRKSDYSNDDKGSSFGDN